VKLRQVSQCADKLELHIKTCSGGKEPGIIDKVFFLTGTDGIQYFWSEKRHPVTLRSVFWHKIIVARLRQSPQNMRHHRKPRLLPETKTSIIPTIEAVSMVDTGRSG